MITVDVLFRDDGEIVTYRVDRAERDIMGGDPSGDMLVMQVEDLLDSGELIGPQVDEFLGAVGNWDHPLHVVAAFMDAARQYGSVAGWGLDDAEVAAAATPDIEGS